MKIGDIIKFRDVLPGRTGILISYGNFAPHWWEILDSEGIMVVWPESQLKVIHESR
jgi:hypothetical protein